MVAFKGYVRGFVFRFLHGGLLSKDFCFIVPS